MNIQTPQGFNFQKIYEAHKFLKNIYAKDDSSILEDKGIKLKMIKGTSEKIYDYYKKALDEMNHEQRDLL